MKLKNKIEKTVHCAKTLVGGHIQTESYSVDAAGNKLSEHSTVHERDDWKLIYVDGARRAKIEVVVTLDGKQI